MTEMFVDLRGPACDVQGPNGMPTQGIENHVHCLERHFLSATGACVNVTVAASLVAALAQVDL